MGSTLRMDTAGNMGTGVRMVVGMCTTGTFGTADMDNTQKNTALGTGIDTGSSCSCRSRTVSRRLPVRQAGSLVRRGSMGCSRIAMRGCCFRLYRAW